MAFEYQETTQDLKTRIDIHQRYGSRNIDEWMLQVIEPSEGARILDVGCGSGKQLQAFHKHLGGKAQLTGGDVNPSLLDEARARNAELGNPWKLMSLDFDRPFELASGSYDLVTCCFALYYARDFRFTVGELHRVLAPGGRLFTTGPMPGNKRLFYEVIQEATGKPIPPMPGSSRYGSEILEAIREQFASVEVNLFENPLEFESIEPFLDYTRASLSEDRKLWKPLFESGAGFDQVMQQIEQVGRRRLSQERRLVMTKLVGGFLAAK
ncbi:MAG: methyltransferase domain-containing protein [Anaerolineales bacterium]